MANGTLGEGDKRAIENATRLSEIGFPEFTAKLITDTFNAITASYFEQMAQYVGVVQAVSQTLQDYINNTQDDIGADEINRFIVSIAGLSDDAVNFLLGDPTTTAQVQLSTDEATAINEAVKLPPAAGTAAVAAPATGGTNLTTGRRRPLRRQSRVASRPTNTTCCRRWCARACCGSMSIMARSKRA
jgi:hypothetical protein